MNKYQCLVFSKQSKISVHISGVKIITEPFVSLVKKKNQ